MTNPISNYQHSNQLFIRRYHPQIAGHTHPYPQILIPLKGQIRLVINHTIINVTYGEALLIEKEVYHQFQSNQDFKFLVVNLDQSFDSLGCLSNDLHFSLDSRTLLYLSFIEQQLITTVNPNIESMMAALLLELLATNKRTKRLDTRLTAVIQSIKSNTASTHTVTSLAKTACLSESQFKVLFKQYFDCTPHDYITELRMQLALGLILNTDTPIAIVAEKCGYQSVSAFTRRFSSFYNQTPSRLRKLGCD